MTLALGLHVSVLEILSTPRGTAGELTEQEPGQWEIMFHSNPPTVLFTGTS